MGKNGQHEEENKTTTTPEDTNRFESIKPLDTSSQSVRPTQLSQSNVVVSQFEVPAELPNEKHGSGLKTSVPLVSAKDTMPVGMSASQLGLDMPRRSIKWNRYIRASLYLVAIVLLIAGGMVIWKNYNDGMTVKTLSFKGYAYSFSFFRSAKYMQSSNGFPGYVTPNKAFAVVGPISNLPDFCSELGSQYTQAFTVKIYGATRPVCYTHDDFSDFDNQIYTVSFSVQSHYHEFVVIYPKSQNSKVYPKLQTILTSVKVAN